MAILVDYPMKKGVLRLKVAPVEYASSVIRIDSVDADGHWLKTLCDIDENGIKTYTGCNDANIKTDGHEYRVRIYEA